MVGNQAIATVIGLVPVVGDVGIAAFRTNFRNAALLEEYLRIRGEEFLKAQADRVEDPTVVKPGAGREDSKKTLEKSPSNSLFSFSRRSTKKVPVAEDTPEDEPKQTSVKPGGSTTSNHKGRDNTKGKARENR